MPNPASLDRYLLPVAGAALLAVPILLPLAGVVANLGLSNLIAVAIGLAMLGTATVGTARTVRVPTSAATR